MLALLALAVLLQAAPPEPVEVAGTYPHLALFNESPECGIGAVVPWAGRLWCVTYSPHRPEGSDDGLYTIGPDLVLERRPESVGGTHAGRLVHSESEQLFLGPYAIDAEGGVRAIDLERTPARITAWARHPEHPEDRVLALGMEEELYEVDVATLAVTELAGTHGLPIPGSHAKGMYLAGDRLVVANNGEWGWHGAWARDPDFAGPSGALAERVDGEWRVVRRTPFCEVTGPGGLYGNASADEPVWATGWDERSVLLLVLDRGEWHTFRLPKASATYDGGHGWYTEWPRIRDVGGVQPGIGADWLLMTMHGTLFRIPPTFRPGAARGLRPLSTHLRMIVDACAWQDRIALACNDVSLFDNPLAGQAHSNLWFLEHEELWRLGPVRGSGGVWLEQPASAGEPSDPYLWAGYTGHSYRTVHLAHTEDEPVTFMLEADRTGDGRFEDMFPIDVPARGYASRVLGDVLAGDWIWVRVRAESDVAKATAWFEDSELPGARWSLAWDAPDLTRSPRSAALLRPAGGGRGTLRIAALPTEAPGARAEPGAYELGPDLELRRVDDPEALDRIVQTAAVRDPGFTVDAASVIVTDHRGRRFRLPKALDEERLPEPDGWPSVQPYDDVGAEGRPRGLREVVTERSLLNAHGTFYEVPRPSAGGVAGIRPICSHGLRIHDFCSWRGLLVLSGLAIDAELSERVVVSDDGKIALWLGVVDDLWRLGPPRGVGGPWRATPVRAGEPSDPYLLRGYDQKRLRLWHDADVPVRFAIEVDVTGRGHWQPYGELEVGPGVRLMHDFPDGWSAAWLRLRADRDVTASALLVYR